MTEQDNEALAPAEDDDPDSLAGDETEADFDPDDYEPDETEDDYDEGDE